MLNNDLEYCRKTTIQEQINVSAMILHREIFEEEEEEEDSVVQVSLAEDVAMAETVFVLIVIVIGMKTHPS